MELAIHRPRPPLDAHVESMTFFAGLNPPYPREKLIPDGAIELIVDLTATAKKLYHSETGPAATDFRQAWISGMQRRPIIIEAQPGASLFVIRFCPGGAHVFLGHPADVLTDGVFGLGDVVGQAATSLRDRILEAGSSARRFAAAETWLLERAGGRLIVNRTVQFLAARLGQGRVRDLVDATGFSERHVQALFRRFVGVTPKQFARIARFKAMLRSLGGIENMELRGDPLPEQDWAGIATAHGFADQSHLSHEFRGFTGITPSAYLARYRGLDNYLPIAVPAPSAEFGFLQDGGSRVGP